MELVAKTYFDWFKLRKEDAPLAVEAFNNFFKGEHSYISWIASNTPTVHYPKNAISHPMGSIVVNEAHDIIFTFRRLYDFFDAYDIDVNVYKEHLELKIFVGKVDDEFVSRWESRMVAKFDGRHSAEVRSFYVAFLKLQKDLKDGTKRIKENDF